MPPSLSTTFTSFTPSSLRSRASHVPRHARAGRPARSLHPAPGPPLLCAHGQRRPVNVHAVRVRAGRGAVLRRDGGGPGAAGHGGHGQPAARVRADQVAAPWEERARLLRLLGMPLSPGNTLVDMYVKCGDFAFCREGFCWDVISWSVLILGHGLNGRPQCRIGAI
jgi:hypothetical protein